MIDEPPRVIHKYISTEANLFAHWPAKAMVSIARSCWSCRRCIKDDFDSTQCYTHVYAFCRKAENCIVIWSAAIIAYFAHVREISRREYFCLPSLQHAEHAMPAGNTAIAYYFITTSTPIDVSGFESLAL
jgi:hypothetical protein